MEISPDITQTMIQFTFNTDTELLLSIFLFHSVLFIDDPVIKEHWSFSTNQTCSHNTSNF